MQRVPIAEAEWADFLDSSHVLFTFICNHAYVRLFVTPWVTNLLSSGAGENSARLQEFGGQATFGVRLLLLQHPAFISS